MESVRVLTPRGTGRPLVYSNPHSGRVYPPDFASSLPIDELRRAEDAYVDHLIADAPDHGIAVISAQFPRAYIDLNRWTDDIDTTLLAGSSPGLGRKGGKSDRGLGLIRRFTRPGHAIYDRSVTSAEIQARLRRCWYPYHNNIAARLETIWREYGMVCLIDWHSMKSVGNAMTPDGIGAHRPDVVISDGDGQTASPVVTNTIANMLGQLGLSVTINKPYKGGTIVTMYGNPGIGIHAIQIEVNRRLYMNEDSVSPISRFTRLKDTINRFANSFSLWIVTQFHKHSVI